MYIGRLKKKRVWRSTVGCCALVPTEKPEVCCLRQKHIVDIKSRAEPHTRRLIEGRNAGYQPNVPGAVPLFNS
jgi:hypothetical protein